MYYDRHYVSVGGCCPAVSRLSVFIFFFSHTATTEIYTLSLHDALPISITFVVEFWSPAITTCCVESSGATRSEEHTSELQSHSDLVCRLLLEKKKNKNQAAAETDRPTNGPPYDTLGSQ